MSYYMGDFYQGDYYAGDPGFRSFFGRIGRAALSFIPGVGAFASKGASALSTALAKRGAGTLAARGTAVAAKVGRVITAHPVLSAAGAAGVVGAASGIMGQRRMGPPIAGGAPMKGFHISRKTGALVRNRHMRVTNPKALRRAIRRTSGFAKLAMRTIHLVHPKKRARFGGFRRRRARARS